MFRNWKINECLQLNTYTRVTCNIQLQPLLRLHENLITAGARMADWQCCTQTHQVWQRSAAVAAEKACQLCPPPYGGTCASTSTTL
jgi:hypothetical protein